MGLLNVLHNAYSEQRKTNHKHGNTDNVYVLGANAGIFCITTGGFLFAFLNLFDYAIYSLIGLLWMVFGLLCFILLQVYDNGRNPLAGHAFLVLGVLGAFLGVGFFLGGVLMAATGALALKCSKKTKAVVPW